MTVMLYLAATVCTMKHWLQTQNKRGSHGDQRNFTRISYINNGEGVSDLTAKS